MRSGAESAYVGGGVGTGMRACRDGGLKPLLSQSFLRVAFDLAVCGVPRCLAERGIDEWHDGLRYANETCILRVTM